MNHPRVGLAIEECVYWWVMFSVTSVAYRRGAPPWDRVLVKRDTRELQRIERWFLEQAREDIRSAGESAGESLNKDWFIVGVREAMFAAWLCRQMRLALARESHA